MAVHPVPYYFKRWGFDLIGTIGRQNGKRFLVYGSGGNSAVFYVREDGRRCFNDGEEDCSSRVRREMNDQDHWDQLAALTP